MKSTSIIILFLAITSITHSQIKMYNGYWTGEIKTKDTSFVVKFSIFNKIAKSGQKNKIISGSIFKPELCNFEDNCFNDSILQLKSTSKKIEYRGVLTLDKNKMSGNLTYRGKVYKLDLRRGNKIILRPQDPKKPFPYITENINFANKKDSIILGGTLTIPKQEGYCPAVILISGSSPIDRNGESNYHQSSLVLADYLTRNGIAVLRYDSRGVNESTGNYYNSTPADFAQDIIAGYNLLCTRKEIDKTKIGLIGHSGGGIVASIVASINPNIGYIVLLASPGIGGKENFLLQTDLKLNVGDYTTNQHTFFKNFYSKCYTMIDKGYDKKTMIDTLSNFKSDYFKLITSASKSNNQMQELIFSSMLKHSISTNNCFYIRHQPSEYLEKVTCPVLSLNGCKDILVPAQINQSAIRNALINGKNPDFTILELNGLNHFFQECKTGSLKESLEIEQTLSPSTLSIIAEWILKHSN